MLIAGCAVLSLCDKNDKTLPVVGYFLLGIAGPFIQMPCFQFSELFGARKVHAQRESARARARQTGGDSLLSVLTNSLAVARVTFSLLYNHTHTHTHTCTYTYVYIIYIYTYIHIYTYTYIYTSYPNSLALARLTFS